MKKHWYTTIFGLIAAGTALAGTAGIHVGHVGPTDWLQLIHALSVAGLGAVAADSGHLEQ